MLDRLKEILPHVEGKPVSSVVFHGVEGENCQTPDSPSWFNPTEASQVFMYVNDLYRLGLSAEDIGIISPYVKQVSSNGILPLTVTCLQGKYKQTLTYFQFNIVAVINVKIVSCFFQTHEIRSVLTQAEFEVPKIGTVEEFQGQEFKVVLLSIVRSQENFVATDVLYNLGFIFCPRRLNVAITRAQALLVIIGNPNVLASDPHWRSVLNYCVERGAYCGCSFNM